MPTQRTLQGLAMALVAMVGLWALLAPSSLGGWMSYVTVEGTSMRPGLESGDFVVVRRQAAYSPGDVVAYASSLGGALVLHRIVDTDGDRFVVKGDNNDFIDLDRPGPPDIVGRQVMVVPGAAGVVTAIGAPVSVVGLLAAASGLVVLGTVFGTRRRSRAAARRSGHHGSPGHQESVMTVDNPLPSPPESTGSSPAPDDRSVPSESRGDLTSVGWSGPKVVGPPALWLAVAAIALVMAVVLWSTPATTAATELRPYVVGLTFDYDTELPPNPVYDDGVVRTGDTVFFAVLDAIDMRVVSDIVSEGVLTGDSQLELSVEVSSTAGWQRELEASTPPASAEPSTSGSIVVDFASARRVADEVASVTGVRGEVTVLVRAAFTVTDVAFADDESLDQVSGGQAGGDARAVETAGGPMIVVYRFAIDDDAATPSAPESVDTELVGSEPQSTPQTSTPSTPADANRPDGSLTRSVVSRQVAVEVTQPAQLNLGFAQVDVSVARWLATALAVVAGGLAIVGLVTYSTARRRGEAAWIAARHRSRLVPVRQLPDGRGRDAVQLDSFDALRAMSTAVDQMIMVETNGEGVSYYVFDGPVTYRYYCHTRPNGNADTPVAGPAEGGGNDTRLGR
jgi:signal peptidase I